MLVIDVQYHCEESPPCNELKTDNANNAERRQKFWGRQSFRARHAARFPNLLTVVDVLRYPRGSSFGITVVCKLSRIPVSKSVQYKRVLGLASTITSKAVVYT